MNYNLKEYRKRRRLSQEELAEMAGVSRYTIIRIESGEPVEIRVATLEALAKALNVSVRSLFLP